MRVALAILPEVRELLDQQPEALRELFGELHDEDSADLVSLLEEPERMLLLEKLGAEEAAAVFERLDEADQTQLVERYGAERLAPIVSEMAPDEVADLVGELPDGVGHRVLDTIHPEAAADVRDLLQWPEDSAGGLMTTEFLSVAPRLTISEVIEHVRRFAKEAETVTYVYVIDASDDLLGVTSLRDLILADGDALVSDIMRERVHSVLPETDQEAVTRLLRKYDFAALPVVDASGKMLGIITADDVMDVMVGEQTEDVQKLGGMEALDLPYLQTSFRAMITKRGGWLAVLFVGEMLTASAMARYEGDIARAVVLALFVPLIISSGGNSGSQAATLVIRAMALDEVKPRDWWRVCRREVSAGLALGAGLALIGLLRVLAWQALFHSYGPHALLIAFTVSISLVGVVLWGTLSGSMLPFAIRGMGFDPASASAPFVATLVDVCGLVIYFTVAHILLGGVLL